MKRLKKIKIEKGSIEVRGSGRRTAGAKGAREGRY